INSSFPQAVRQALDESTERLPWRVTHRLEQARAAALARLPSEDAHAATAGSAQHQVQSGKAGQALPSPGGSSAATRGHPGNRYAAVLRAIRRATQGTRTT